AALEHGGIRHLPQVLSRDLPVPEETGRAEAVREWVSSLQADAQFAEEGGLGRVRWSRACLPAVTVIIPTRDHAPLLRTCLKSLYRTDYPGLDILIVDNGSTDSNALRLLRAAERQPGTRVMKYPGPFNYAAINNAAVREATGDYVCFLNNDTEVINVDWLTEMASLLVAQGDRAGCVGAKLLWPNGLVQHGGVVVGTHELAAHIGNGWMADEPGYGQRNRLVCQYSAVTAACLLTPKRLFADLGGFDARRFPVAFNDVDYCLRVRRSGKKILWTPFATLWHRESASRGQDVSPMDKARLQREMGCFRKEWGTYQDPFYNPNLPLSTVTDPFEGLAVPPRARNAR
ncbi:MAG: glycosyltransferase family 2 protein, partial [Desulfovibrio sp.]|nr:glycosyltransferase family 2 protein [Desulfovibrio sp.]